MFLFIQTKRGLSLLSNYSLVSEILDQYPYKCLLHDEKNILLSTCRCQEDQFRLDIRIQGHQKVSIGPENSAAIVDKPWNEFGTRFLFNKSNQQWTVDTDAVCAFPLYMMSTEKGIVMTDRLRTAVDLGFCEGADSKDWLCDMLLSGFPHDTCTPVAAFRKCSAGMTVCGRSGAVTAAIQSKKDNSEFTSLSNEEAISLGRQTLSQVLRSYPTFSLGIHLTGGYDSRLILASLLRSGIKPKTFIFGAEPNYNSNIAGELAQKLGLDHTFIHLDNHFGRHVADYYQEATLLTDATLSPSHTHYYYATKAIAERVSALVTGIGGGELHRGFLEHNVAFPWLLGKPLQNCFTVSTFPETAQLAFLLVPELKQQIKSRAMELLHDWKKDVAQNGIAGYLLRNVFGSYFRSIMALENSILPTYYPFIDPHLTRILLRAPYGPVRGKNFSAGPIYKLKSQSAIVRKYVPGPSALLSTSTDKGFPPGYLLKPWLWSLIPLSVRTSRIKRRKMNELKNMLWLNTIADQWGKELIETIPELDPDAWEKFRRKIKDEYQRWILSRIIHVAATRKYLKK